MMHAVAGGVDEGEIEAWQEGKTVNAQQVLAIAEAR